MYRYLIVLALVVLLVQGLIWVWLRSIDWFICHKMPPRTKKAFIYANYFLMNLFVLLSLLRVIPEGFRYTSVLIVCLWYVCLVACLLAILQRLFVKTPQQLSLQSKVAWRAVAIVLLAGLFALSVYLAYVPRVVHYTIRVDKPMQALRIGVASDLHLGKIFGSKQLDRLQTIFDQEKVDLVLMPGDIMDDNLDVYLAEDMAPHFANLHAPMGVYATLGNHDYFQQPQQIAQEIVQEGVHLLLDQAVVVDGRLIIVGRNDELDPDRLPVRDILATVPQTQRERLPILLMDHRPMAIAENMAAGVDVQVSGHTHQGQVFPGNLLVKFLYSLSYGYRQFQQQHTFVTSGYGLWGVPFRLGSRSEVLIIDIVGS